MTQTSVEGWLAKLTAQLPGWKVWHVSGLGYCAAPAPAGTALADVGHLGRLDHRIGPYLAPQDLRAAARERYGWDDHCGSCGVLARDCGHRQPETRVKP